MCSPACALQIPRSISAGLEDEVGIGIRPVDAPEVGEGTRKPAEGGPSGQGRGENASWALAFAAVGHWE